MIEIILVGPGRMGQNYLECLQQDNRVQVNGVIGNSEEKLKQINRIQGLKLLPSVNCQMR